MGVGERHTSVVVRWSVWVMLGLAISCAPRKVETRRASAPRSFKVHLLPFSHSPFAAPNIYSIERVACYVFETSAHEVAVLVRAAELRASVLKRAEQPWTKALKGCMRDDVRVKVYDLASKQALAITTRFSVYARKRNGDTAIMESSLLARKAAIALFCEARRRSIQPRHGQCGPPVEPIASEKMCKGCKPLFPTLSDCEGRPASPQLPSAPKSR